MGQAWVEKSVVIVNIMNFNFVILILMNVRNLLQTL